MVSGKFEGAKLFRGSLKQQQAKAPIPCNPREWFGRPARWPTHQSRPFLPSTRFRNGISAAGTFAGLTVPTWASASANNKPPWTALRRKTKRKQPLLGGGGFPGSPTKPKRCPTLLGRWGVPSLSCVRAAAATKAASALKQIRAGGRFC